MHMLVYVVHMLVQVVVVTLATLATYLGQWEYAPYNLKILGEIPAGLPSPRFPSFPDVSYGCVNDD